jgi:hypothetical protein
MLVLSTPVTPSNPRRLDFCETPAIDSGDMIVRVIKTIQEARLQPGRGMLLI